MKVKLLGFGIIKDFWGGNSLELELPENPTVDTVRRKLNSQYPGMKELASYMIAINDSYAPDEGLIHSDDEIAVIPPVSGG